MHAELRYIPLPDFGEPIEQPHLPASLHAARLSEFIARLGNAGLDAAIIYADREHAANIQYLTGFGPRFEEALLVLRPDREPILLTGPENQGMGRVAPLGLEVRLFQPFGLLGQNREQTVPLPDHFRQCGLDSGMALGAVGWKYFGPKEGHAPDSMLDLPSYIVEAARSAVGDAGRIVNIAGLLMHPTQGQRATNEIEQIAAFEFASCHTSSAVRNVVRGARPGMREFDAARLLAPIGLPLSCHTMLSSGPRAALGLDSPTSKLIERGDPITVAYGVWGALNCRAGWMIAGADELPASAKDYVERLVGPYFCAVASWYQTLRIGVTGGDIFATVRQLIGDPFFGVQLNPGHLIHIDEWMNTPIYKNSQERLTSGMTLQMDIIPATGTSYFTSNAEDGIALLDPYGRDAFAERFAGAWMRICARREFMQAKLGISLHPDVLPLSNLAGHLSPFFLAPDNAMVLSS